MGRTLTLNDFLVIDEELELKGLTGSGNEELDNESPVEPEQQKPSKEILLGHLT